MILVYMNSLLATLNARKHIRGMDVDSEGLSVSLPVVHPTVTIGGTDVCFLTIIILSLAYVMH
jgi:hypothetical protein